MLELLRRDAELLTTTLSPEQAKLLGGDAKPTDGAAVWAGSPEAQEQARRERQEAIEAYTREWGRPPSW